MWYFGTRTLFGPKILIRASSQIRWSATSKAETIRGLTKDLNVQDLLPQTEKLYHDLLAGQRYALARCITLVESSNRQKALEARKLLTLVEKHMRQERPGDLQGQARGTTFRIGLSGPPGAGKSTFIENFGRSLTAEGHRVAVLAVDPSSGMLLQ